jgi:AcrR family transcriptional regulator
MDSTAEAPVPAEKQAKTWQRRKQARPGEILDAAIAVFAEKGYAAARMEDIGVKAGVTKGTIYLYFPSKEEVFKSLARQHITDMLAITAENARKFEGKTFDFLAAFIQGCITKMNSDASVLPKIIISEARNFPELAKFWREEVIDKSLGMLSAIIAKGVARGEVRDVPPDHIARLCVAPMLMGLIWRNTFAQTDDEPFDYAGFLALHCDVLFRGLTPDTTNQERAA